MLAQRREARTPTDDKNITTDTAAQRPTPGAEARSTKRRLSPGCFSLQTPNPADGEPVDTNNDPANSATHPLTGGQRHVSDGQHGQRRPQTASVLRDVYVKYSRLTFDAVFFFTGRMSHTVSWRDCCPETQTVSCSSPVTFDLLN